MNGQSVNGAGIRIGVSVTVRSPENGSGAAFSGLREALRKAMREAGEAAASEAKRLAPVKTGRLRDSIGCTLTEGDGAGSVTAVVGTDVPYAAAQELGTAKRPGKHFLENGMAAGAAALGS